MLLFKPYHIFPIVYGGLPFEMSDMVPKTETRRSRAFSPRRAGGILKTRSDLVWVKDGLYEVTAVPA